nr:OmpW family outer membrane protein [Microvirga makkahensis]
MVTPELDISYFFTPNLAAELILGLTPHRVKGAGTFEGVRIYDAWLLPPTLMLRYHSTGFGGSRPLWVPASYTPFLNERAKGDFESFNIENNIAFARQAGVDFMIDEHWGINRDAKKIVLETDVSVNDGLVKGKVKVIPGSSAPARLTGSETADVRLRSPDKSRPHDDAANLHGPRADMQGGPAKVRPLLAAHLHAKIMHLAASAAHPEERGA